MPNFTHTFIVFAGLEPLNANQQTVVQTLFPPLRLLLLAQGETVRDHGDEFGIRRLAFDV